jgi:hypothetical protein
MEADWEVEIGPEAPIIEALWPGFVDLRRTPERIGEIAEAGQFLALAEALLRINKSGSQIWTSKCDLWTPDPRLKQWDQDEMDATTAESAVALACYIDLLPQDASLFVGLAEAEAWVRATIRRLHEAVCRCCRADLVIRRAFQADREGLGITVYATACGADSETAEKSLSGALTALGEAISATANSASKIGGALQ